MFYLVNTMAIAAVDQNKTEKIKKIEKRLPKLSETKLKALMEHIGKPVPKNFFSCLCGPGRVAGGGCKHVPGKACWCGGPLGGGGYVGFVKKRYDGCIESKIYDDNTTIIDAIAGGAVSARSPKVPEIGLQSLLKELFEKSCLPVPKDVDNLNPHEMTWLGDVLDKNHISSMTQTHALSNIYDNILKAANICEASIETKLSIDATQGKGILGTAASLVWIVKGKDQFDIFKGYASLSAKVEDSIYLSDMSKKALPLIQIFDYYNKYKSLAKTYDNHIDLSQKNSDIKDALAVYKKSKSWNLEQINSSINNFNKSQTNIFNSIKRIEKERDKQLKQITDEENILIGAMKEEISNNPNSSAGWAYGTNLSELQSKKSEISRDANKRITTWLLTSNSNLIKSQILEQYRKPLIEKSCNEYIDDRLKNCPANIRRDKPLTHEDINKLWDKTKTKIRIFKEEMKYIDEVNSAELIEAPKRRIQK